MRCYNSTKLVIRVEGERLEEPGVVWKREGGGGGGGRGVESKKGVRQSIYSKQAVIV